MGKTTGMEEVLVYYVLLTITTRLPFGRIRRVVVEGLRLPAHSLLTTVYIFFFFLIATHGCILWPTVLCPLLKNSLAITLSI